MAATALVLLWFNFWGHDANGAAPRLLDWTGFAADMVGFGGAWAVQLIYRNVRPPHRPSVRPINDAACLRCAVDTAARFGGMTLHR